MNRLTGRGNPTTWPRPYVEAGRHGLTTPDAKSTAIDDVRLANEVDRILRATGYMPLRDLEVIAHDGIVSLSGHVPSYYMK